MFRSGFVLHVILIGWIFTPFLLQSIRAERLRLDGCGAEFSCFAAPSGCETGGLGRQGAEDTDGCAVVAKFGRHNTDPSLLVIMLATRLGPVDLTNTNATSGSGLFVALGQSRDIWMGDDSVVSCLYDPAINSFSADLSYNEFHSNIVFDRARQQVPGKTLSLESASVEDGQLQCTIHRQIASISERRLFSAEEKFHIIVVRGLAMPGGNGQMTKAIHGLADGDSFPFVSFEAVKLSVEHDSVYRIENDHGWASKVSRSAQYRLAKAHGCLMIIGVWLCFGTSVLFGKFLKPFWGNSKILFGKQLWFQVHRWLNFVGASAMLLAFALIFVNAGRFITEKQNIKIHALLGTFAIAFLLLQLANAALRCAPEDAWRPFFRNCHRYCAWITLALSFAAIFWATQPDLNKIGLFRSYALLPQNIVVAYIVVFVFTILCCRMIYVWRSIRLNRAVASNVKPGALTLQIAEPAMNSYEFTAAVGAKSFSDTDITHKVLYFVMTPAILFYISATIAMLFYIAT